jgi:hypothetical protein
MNILDEYNIINRSYKKKLVFHLGAEAGFYSEFNNMVAAILYCLKNEIQFVLYSKDANFGYKNGWTDYFLPFCKETTFFIHRLFNTRTNKPMIKKQQIIKLLLWKTYRYFTINTYLTYELWDKFYSKEFDKEYFDIPKLGIRGDLREASAVISTMIYQFNTKSKFKIADYMNSLDLPKEYLSMQIRRGDKNIEWSFIPTDNYFIKASLINSCKNVFLLTDDYSIIEDTNTLYPKWQIYTLTENTEKGYYHSNFIHLPKEDIRKRILKLFASVEIIRNSSFFIGTFTTNVAFFIGMIMPFDKVISIQKKAWFQFSKYDVRQDEVK